MAGTRFSSLSWINGVYKFLNAGGFFVSKAGYKIQFSSKSQGSLSILHVLLEWVESGQDHLALSFCKCLILSLNFLMKMWPDLPQYVCVVVFSLSSKGWSRNLTGSSPNGYYKQSTNALRCVEWPSRNKQTEINWRNHYCTKINPMYDFCRSFRQKCHQVFLNNCTKVFSTEKASPFFLDLTLYS